MPHTGYMFTTNATKTSQLSSKTLNRVVRTMIELAESVGKANLSEFNADCSLCGDTHPLSNIDAGHVIPASQGGTASPANVVPMCKECNNALGDRDATAILRYDARHLWNGELVKDATSCRVRNIESRWLGTP